MDIEEVVVSRSRSGTIGGGPCARACGPFLFNQVAAFTVATERPSGVRGKGFLVLGSWCPV